MRNENRRRPITPFFRPLLGLILFAAWASPAPAQFAKPKVRIVDAKVGLPASKFTNERDDGGAAARVCKTGLWAPVSFRLEILGETDKPLQVEITAYDSDDAKTITRWPLGTPVLNDAPTGADDKFRPRGSFVEPGEFMAKNGVPLVRPGGNAGKITLQILTNEPDSSPSSVSDPVALDNVRLRDTSVYVILSLGSKLGGFDLPALPGDPQRGDRLLRNGRIETAAFSSVEELPDLWFGYETADLIVLATGGAGDEFLTKLFQDDFYKPKRDALREYVSRGGRLVISLGGKLDVLNTVPFKAFLPVTATPERVESLSLNFTGPTKSGIETELKNPTKIPKDADGNPLKDKDGNAIPPAPADTFRVAKLRPKAGTAAPYSLSPEMAKNPRAAFEGSALPLVVQVPLGLGRITVVAFDLDTSPFRDNEKRTEFWDWLIRKAGSEKSALTPEKYDPSNAMPGVNPVASEDGITYALRQHVDTFEGVPVISFGWVALFIVLYTLLIGPVEYLFLKKILGRLELTWITFPIIVLSVSAAAYFTAYEIKGKDLRVNKIDVVDIDVGGNRVYGQTWFTVFSPRIDNYTVGIEPKEPWGYGSQDAEVTSKPVTVVDWMGGSRIGQGGGIARSIRNYQYRIDPKGGTNQAGATANGLSKVPVQVWSTKTFTANWSGYLDEKAPPVTSTVAHLPSAPLGAAGTITINLPLPEVQDAIAYFAGKPYKLDKGIGTGVPIKFNPGAGTPDAQDWARTELAPDAKFYASGDTPDNYAGRNPPKKPQPETGAGPLALWGMLFHEAGVLKDSGGRGLQNSTLRRLDQSWRLSEANTEEVIVLLKLAKVSGNAEEMMTSPDGASPSTLWLKALPGSGPRPAVPGTLQQETYIRIYIPVKGIGK